MVPGAPKLPTGADPSQGQKFSLMDIISALLSGSHNQNRAGTAGDPDVDPRAMPPIAPHGTPTPGPTPMPTPMATPSPTPGPTSMAPPMGSHPMMQLAMAKQGMPNPMEHDEEKPGMKKPMGRRV